MVDFTGSDQEFKLSFNVSDAVEPELIPEGDYTAEITRAEMHTKDDGKVSLHVMFKVHDTGLSNPNIVHRYFGLPTADDTKEAINSKLLGLKRFFEAFNLEQDADGSVDLAMAEGLTGDVHIGIEPEKGDYPAKNKISRFGSVR